MRRDISDFVLRQQHNHFNYTNTHKDLLGVPLKRGREEEEGMGEEMGEEAKRRRVEEGGDVVMEG